MTACHSSTASPSLPTQSAEEAVTLSLDSQRSGLPSPVQAGGGPLERVGREAFVGGAVLGIVLAGLALAVAGSAGLLPAGCAGYATGGAAVGAILAMGTTWFQLLVVRAQTGAGIQAGLGLAFVAKLLGLAIGAAVLSFAGVKFHGVATFLVTLAVVALIVQAAGTFQLVRAMRRPADPRH